MNIQLLDIFFIDWIGYISSFLVCSYWNSRLATERQRLLNCFTQSDIVCEFVFQTSVGIITCYPCCCLNLILLHTGDVFAGVGPLAIAAAKRVRHVYANDLNPNAVDFLKKNCVLNKLGRKIEVRVLISRN